MQKKQPARPRDGYGEAIKGITSIHLTERCPDQRTVFPSSPCRNVDCEWTIACTEYMNCCFVAAQAGEHPLQLIGDFLGLTREGVRKIEKRGLNKLRESRELGHEPVHKPMRTSGTDNLRPRDKKADTEDDADSLPALHGRELGQ